MSLFLSPFAPRKCAALTPSCGAKGDKVLHFANKITTSSRRTFQRLGDTLLRRRYAATGRYVATELRQWFFVVRLQELARSG